MKWAAVIAIVVLSLLGESVVRADAPRRPPQVGEQHEIVRRYETHGQDSDGSSSNSSGRTDLSEQVIAVSEGGIELEYDIWLNATAEDRERNWMFPARVLRQADGTMRLLNQDDLEARLARWLTAAGWSQEVCGRWIFTWDAFLIECNPAAVIDVIKSHDLFSSEVREGASYPDPNARSPGTMRRIAQGPDGARFAVTMEVDPDAVRRQRADGDVAAGEIMQQPVTIETARLARANERVSGTIEVTIDTDRDGRPRQRTTVTRLEITRADGITETRTLSETIERRPVLR